MNNEFTSFLNEGLLRYKEAAQIMVTFGKEIEKRLQMILSGYNNWKAFKPTAEAKVKSTMYWSAYPLLNARIKGEYAGKEVTLTIAINWYAAQSNIPFYEVWFEQGELFQVDNEVDLEPKMEIFERGINYFIDEPKIENLEGDFYKLLDQFNTII